MLNKTPLLRCTWTWPGLALFFALLISGDLWAAGVNPRQGPRILVPPVLGIARSTSLKSHYAIVHALRQRFGERVVDDTQVVQAQKKHHIWPRKLRKPAAVAQLAQAVDAERALIISATRRGLSVAVYVDVHKAPTRIIRIKKIKARRIGKRQARRIAKIVARKATLLLSAEPFPALTAPQPRTAKADKGQKSAENSESHAAEAGWDAIDVQVGDLAAPDAEAEIRAEEQRETMLQNQILSNKNSKLSIFAALGFSMSRRNFAISGSQAAWVVPIQSGLLPYVSLTTGFYPLRLAALQGLRAYDDLALQITYQRALYRSLYQGEELSVDDDNMNLRLSYSQALWSWSKSPSLGLGLGYGWQRAEIHSDAALLSSRYSFVELFSQLKQPLWKKTLVFQALLSARQPLDSDSGLRPAPSWSAELWLTARLKPWWYARLGLRSRGFRAWRGALLQVDEHDNSLQLELGGYY